MVRTLLYYHIFDFPLTLDEIWRLTGHRWAGPAEVAHEVADLVGRGLVGVDGGHHFVGPRSYAAERLADEDRARGALPRAARWSHFIGRFPYVRGVAVSGTLSKGIMKQGDDLDYMVFTAPGRVWLCRMVLMSFKKIFLLNSHHHFCVNYLLAADRLELPDRDLFTATEIAWLLPMVNPELYRRFVAANRWVARHLPNWRPRGVDGVREAAPGRWRRAVEGGVDRLGGGALDDWSRRLISRRNRRRYRHLDIRHEVALRSAKHASKHHPRAFRDRVLGRLADEVAAFEARHGVAVGLPAEVDG